MFKVICVSDKQVTLIARTNKFSGLVKSVRRSGFEYLSISFWWIAFYSAKILIPVGGVSNIRMVPRTAESANCSELFQMCLRILVKNYLGSHMFHECRRF